MRRISFGLGAGVKSLVANAIAPVQAEANTAITNAATAQGAANTAMNKADGLAVTAATFQEAVAASQADRTSLHTQLDALALLVSQIKPQNIVISGGQAATPALALGATANIVVTLSKPMPDVNYQATAVLAGAAGLLSTLSVLGITARTTTTVTVQVKASGLLTTTGTVEVIAVKLV